MSVKVCLYDENRQMLIGSFGDYAMPRVDLVRRLTIQTVLVPFPSDQLGVKGSGKASTVDTLPTAINATLDVLHPYGMPHQDMPTSAQRVWQALRKCA